jgi:oligopeptide/dipeptide ABC transporter ATP-binding protein
MDAILEVEALQKYFPASTRLLQTWFGRQPPAYIKAVDDVNFAIAPGETLGLVGESGCGKSTTGKLIMRALEPTAGKIWFNGQDITQLQAQELRHFRQQVQIVFQDPYTSLNPRMTVARIVSEPITVHRVEPRYAVKDRVSELLALVGLNEEHGRRYPHELSGGQRQRVAIARALAVRPQLIVADEAVSALDVSVQAQILNLFMELREQFDLAYLFVSHNLSVIKYMSHRVAVMYLGRIVEIGPADRLFAEPLHPYTQALLSAIPVIGNGRESMFDNPAILLEGELPNPIDLPPGCRFYSRCASRMDICRDTEPVLLDAALGHQVACHLYDQKTADETA